MIDPTLKQRSISEMSDIELLLTHAKTWENHPSPEGKEFHDRLIKLADRLEYIEDYESARGGYLHN